MAANVALLPRPRLSVRLLRNRSKCCQHRTYQGLGINRCVSTDSTPASSKFGSDAYMRPPFPSKLLSEDTAADDTEYSASATTQKHTNGSKKEVLGLQRERNDEELYALFRADALNRFYIPAVMMDTSKRETSPAFNTVHVLGQDNTAKFLSHSLKGAYDEVKVVAPKPQDSYRNVSFSNKQKWTGGHVEVNAAEARNMTRARKEKKIRKEKDDGYITDLFVAGPASDAIPLLKSVKHRVDQNTAVCYMQEGLGIAEAANNDVFTDAETRPSIVLGHTTQALARDRKNDAVRFMKQDYETYVTGVRPFYRNKPSLDTTNESWQRTHGMLSKIAGSGRLHAMGLQYDRWLEVKIPSLMFSSVVEPVCAMLDYNYRDILRNRMANRLIDQLLQEIAEVVAQLPEARQSWQLVELLRGPNMRRRIMGKLVGKQDAPSKMLEQIRRGELTDIDFLNGYFVQRGRKAGIKMPANEMVIGLVKAKQMAGQIRSRDWVPLEVTSRLD